MEGDPESGQAFRDSTLADHPVLFEQERDLARLQDMLREVRQPVVHEPEEAVTLLGEHWADELLDWEDE